MLPADPEQVLRIKKTLQDYATTVGLRINFSKSTLVPVNVPADTTEALAGLLGCAVGCMPFTYLGLPM